MPDVMLAMPERSMSDINGHCIIWKESLAVTNCITRVYGIQYNVRKVFLGAKTPLQIAKVINKVSDSWTKMWKSSYKLKML